MVSQDVASHLGLVNALEGAVVASAVEIAVLRGREVSVNDIPGSF